MKSAMKWFAFWCAVLAGWVGYRWVADHSPLTELDDWFDVFDPPPRDTYLDGLHAL